MNKSRISVEIRVANSGNKFAPYRALGHAFDHFIGLNKKSELSYRSDYIPFRMSMYDKPIGSTFMYKEGGVVYEIRTIQFIGKSHELYNAKSCIAGHAATQVLNALRSK